MRLDPKSRPGDPAGSAPPWKADQVASGADRSKRSLALPDGSDAEALFRAHSPWLLRSLRRKFGREVADDLLQETYLRVVRQAQPAEIQSPKAFLLQVARNLFIDGYKRDRARADYEASLFAIQARAAPAAQVETVVLKEIILAMPLKLRDVFVLSRFGGLTNAQIAEHLGLSEKTVEWRMTRALAWCAAQLRP